MTWKIIGGISVVIMCFLSVLSYKGKYWPLRKEYLDHPNRREWQKRNAILLSLMAISGFFTQFILKDLENKKFYDFGYIIMIILFLLYITDHYFFVKKSSSK